LAINEIVTLAGPSSWILSTFLLRGEGVLINHGARKIFMIFFYLNGFPLLIGG
jgi:hypothetical protein